MRERLCSVCRGWHATDEPWPDECDGPWEELKYATHLSIPMVIGDSIPDLQSQVDGKHYSSKSALRRSYKAAGVIEIGNDVPTTRGAPRVDPDRDRKQTAAIANAMKRVGLPTA